MRAGACWNGYSHLAHLRQKFERCDAHWHRPKRADWRAKAYERAARWTCEPTGSLILNGREYRDVMRPGVCLSDRLSVGATVRGGAL